MAAAIVSLVPVLVVVLMTVLAFLFTRRPRPVTSMIPAFTGAILAGATLGTTFCTFGLLNVIQGIRVSGSGGLAAVSAGIETAHQILRICLYASAFAAAVLLPRFFLSLRRRDSTSELAAGGPSLIFFSSVLPLLFAVAGFSMFHRLSDMLISPGSHMMRVSESAVTFAAQVSSRSVLIATVGLAGFGLCLLGVFAPLFIRAGARSDGVARRFGTAFLPITAGFLIVAIVLVERFFAMVRSYGYRD